jgi:hypothetical protein
MFGNFNVGLREKKRKCCTGIDFWQIFEMWEQSKKQPVYVFVETHNKIFNIPTSHAII